MNTIRTTLFLFYLVWTGILFGQSSKSYDFCYNSKNGICVYSLKDKKETLVVKINQSANPYLSSDGENIAYTSYCNQGNSICRQISVMNLSTKKRSVLETQNDNCYGPVWSPNSRFIAFNSIRKTPGNYTWKVDIFDLELNKVIAVTQILKKGCFSPSWSSDSKKVIVHDMDSVYMFNLGGFVTQKYSVKEIDSILVYGISSSTTFLLTDDERKIVFESSVYKDDDLLGFEEPPIALFIYDAETKHAKRLTPKGCSCSSPFISGNRILFNAYFPKSKDIKICSIKLDGSDFKIEFSDRQDITCKKE
jgi:Tol biopolymer transport system component